ncbi:Aste57867_8829 [Aphanomyces stellatus]|uniref:Aste57867_8829 protein n=1 Tax=Aphanomyces stellatus TaxID=120398 RepID=A0A485KLF1_9STRA|nr:hypothetical protein As57867_008794 [Aphanomyces stellatus]VFT85715.1 Aste57867_8829 [Aphanomyces stellatus]
MAKPCFCAYNLLQTSRGLDARLLRMSLAANQSIGHFQTFIVPAQCLMSLHDLFQDDSSMLATPMINLNAIAKMPTDHSEEGSPCGADTDFFLSTSAATAPPSSLPDDALLFTWPLRTDMDASLDDLLLPHTVDADDVESTMDELRAFTAVLVTPPRPIKPTRNLNLCMTPSKKAKRTLRFDDGDLEAVYCEKRQKPDSVSPASLHTHYGRQRAEIAVLKVDATALEGKLEVLRGAQRKHHARSFEALVKAQEARVASERTNAQLKDQVRRRMAQRHQLESIVFGDAGVLC